MASLWVKPAVTKSKFSKSHLIVSFFIASHSNRKEGNKFVD